MTFAEIQKMSPAEINQAIAKSKLELLKITLQTSSENSKQTHKLKEARKHIARLKTSQNASKKSN